MISIIDYGLGNLASVQNMLRKIGVQARIVSTASEIASSESLILPGVGAFDRGVRLLHARDLWSAISDRVCQGTPILGICLGMQLLTAGSEEGTSAGFGFVPGFTRRFSIKDDSVFKVPHMGWSFVEVVKPNPLIDAGGDVQKFYFVHSYRVVLDCGDDEFARAEHEAPFTAAFQRGLVFGTQFHPEKSHKYGMSLMKKFSFVTAAETLA